MRLPKLCNFRPDDWIITKAMNRVQTLPESPQLASSENAVRDTPRPIRAMG